MSKGQLILLTIVSIASVILIAVTGGATIWYGPPIALISYLIISTFLKIMTKDKRVYKKESNENVITGNEIEALICELPKLKEDWKILPGPKKLRGLLASLPNLHTQTLILSNREKRLHRIEIHFIKSQGDQFRVQLNADGELALEAKSKFEKYFL